MKYKSVIVTQRGGPDVLQGRKNDLHPPSEKEARIKISACAVCLPDVQARYGQSPFKLKTPFTPGYAIIGVVDEIGAQAVDVSIGDNVAALTISGGYSEYIYWDAADLISVPPNLDPGEAVTLILNYLVAYQTLHRSAKVKSGDKVLIIGASGGIGTAYLQLGKLAGLKMYGLASPSKHHILKEYGAIPIDYHTEDYVEVIRQAEPEGLDAVFDGMGGEDFKRGFSLLRSGGTLVGYGNPLRVSHMLKLFGLVLLFTLQPNGKTAKLYGTGASRLNRKPFLQDWTELFRLLGEGQIKPIIMEKFPILEAREANELLESGRVIGNIVLVAPEYL